MNLLRAPCAVTRLLTLAAVTAGVVMPAGVARAQVPPQGTTVAVSHIRFEGEGETPAFVVDGVIDALEAAGLDVVPPDETAGVLPPDAEVDVKTCRAGRCLKAIAEAAAAEWVVFGRAAVRDEGVRLELTAVNPASGAERRRTISRLADGEAGQQRLEAFVRALFEGDGAEAAPAAAAGGAAAAAAATASRPAAPPPPPPEPACPPTIWMPLKWTALALTVASAGALAAGVLLSQKYEDDFNAAFRPGRAVLFPENTKKNAELWANVATAMIPVSAVFAAATVTFFVLDAVLPPPAASATPMAERGWRVLPAAGPSGGSITFAARF